jgi:nucleoside-diphosphate-sugar epimerase
VSAPRALVTGGAGVIGGPQVESLVADGWHPRGLDDFSTGREANLAAVSFRHIAGDGIQGVTIGRRGPIQPFIRAIFTAIAVDKMEGRQSYC